MTLNSASRLTLALAAIVGLPPLPAPAAEVPEIVIGPYLHRVDRRSASVRWETAAPAPTMLSWGFGSPAISTFEDLQPTIRHEVVLHDLRPATVYWYRVDTGATSSEPARFRTAGDRAEPLRIVALGDTRTGHTMHRAAITEINTKQPHLVLHTGDLVGSPSEAEWRTFFAIEGPILRSAPTFPALGNHEGDGRRFLQLFGPAGEQQEEGRYSVSRWGNVAILTVDTNQPIAPGSLQYVWLAATLEALRNEPDVLFRIVILHWGPFSAGAGHGSNVPARLHLAPLFSRCRVDLVLSGHDHIYERSTINGVKYVVTGGGGAPLHAAGHDWWTEVAVSAHHYCTMVVEGGTLSFDASETASGKVLDRFILRKRHDECAIDADCQGQPRDCPRLELGTFRCVATTCVWNCEALPSVPHRVRPRLPATHP